MQNNNGVLSNIEKIASLFPSCVTESLDENGNKRHSIDFDMLRQELSDNIVEGREERYQFMWPNKKNAILLANSPIKATLRPEKDKSVNFDTTENLYIEGDNLDVLKCLKETYLGKIKMIYIDPPYNTGHDFVYEDNYATSAKDYLANSGQYDSIGNQLVENLDNNGRFHTDWLNMMYSRIKLSRDLLSEDGVMIMSISDAEFDNLKKICDEIFGQQNYLGDILWNSTKSVTNTALISVSHTYNLVYFKKMVYFVEHRNEFRLPDDGEGFANPDNDPRGPWKADPFQVGGWRPNQQYEITNPNTGVVYKPNPGCSWKNDYNKFVELMADNRIVFGASGEAGPQRKRFIWEAQERGKVSKTWWDDVETTTNGTQLLKKLFDGVCPFDNPKPVGLIKKLLQLGSSKDCYVLDFFSGSATTAHAVMELNAEEGTKRKFILVQIQQEIDPSDKAYELGFRTICEIGEERIRRAVKYIKDNATTQLQPFDDGFRVLRLDSSNMEDVYYSPANLPQEQLSLFADNIKEGRTAEDLVFQVMLELGATLDSKIESTTVAGKKVFNIANGYIIACFDDKIDDEVIKAIAKLQPEYAVFRDCSMADDSTMTNFEQIFKTLSPSTNCRIL